jgi:hypothetical protein
MTGCTPTKRGLSIADPERLGYLVGKVCIPQVAHSIPVSEIEKQEGFHWKRSCDFQACHNYFVKQGRGLVVLDPTTSCATSVVGNIDLQRFQDAVAHVLQTDAAGWYEAQPRMHPAYGKRYCNRLNDAEVSTFGVTPGHAPKEIATFVHQSSFDVHVTALGCRDVVRPTTAANPETSGDVGNASKHASSQP